MQNHFVACCLAVAFAALAAPPAGADPERGAALAVPYFASSLGGTFTITQVAVTNVGDSGIGLGLEILDGGAGGSWGALSASCNMTTKETVTITLVNFTFGGGTRTILDAFGIGCVLNETFDSQRGILFFYATRLGIPVSEDVISATVTVFERDGAAYSIDAVVFQGGPANDGNLDFDFDNIEYRAFPEEVSAQIHVPDGDVDTRLILFTLDGRPGVAPTVDLAIELSDDNARSRTIAHSFACFTVINLSALDPTFNRIATDSRSGRVVIRSVLGVGPREPVHGWVMTRMASGGQYGGGGGSMTSSSAGATRLSPSVADFVAEDDGDVKLSLLGP